MADLRVQIIERICRLPEENLAKVATFLNQLEQMPIPSAPPCRDWPHAPLHRLSEHGTFIVTASTMSKEHLFRGPERLTFLEAELLEGARGRNLSIEAWAVFSNHYHIIVSTESENNQLASFLAELHTKTAAEINRLDGAPERRVWFNYWDTQLTFEKSYFARLNYVHQNPVKHGLVARATDYRWCSAAWFERTATRAQVKTIYSFKTDRVKIEDDYEPIM